MILGVMSLMFGVRSVVVGVCLTSELLWSMIGRGADCFFFWTLVAFLDWAVVHPPRLGRQAQLCMSSPGLGGAGLLRLQAGPAFGGIGDG